MPEVAPVSTIFIPMPHECCIRAVVSLYHGCSASTNTHSVSKKERYMQIGCHLPTQGAVATREALITFARRAEDAHMASLWVSDHVVFPRMGNSNYPSGRFPHAPDTAYLEPVTVLAAAALCTDRALLGSSVFILGHRNPVVM